MNWLDWYNSLTKPSWTPPPTTISLIWRILYPIIILSFGFVLVQAIRGKLPWTVALPFAFNLVANLIFTPILFLDQKLAIGVIRYSNRFGNHHLDDLHHLAVLPLGLQWHNCHILFGYRLRPSCNCRSRR